MGTKVVLQTKVMQSIQTSFGMSFNEQACKIIGEANGFKVDLQKKVKGHMFPEVEAYISKLNNSLEPKFNRDRELETIRELCKKNQPIKKSAPKEFPDSTVDVYVTTPDGREFLIDVTTVKPNKKEFRVLKEKSLRWAAYRMSEFPEIKIEPYLAIPYNPEGSSITDTTYTRHQKFYDRSDLLVGDELWLKVSDGNCSITEIEEVFKNISNEIGSLIRNAFNEISST